MAVSFSPPPGTGTLPGDGGSVTITVTSTSGGSYGVFLRLKNGTRLRLDIGTVWAGANRVRVTLPPGGIPSGATLSVVVNEAGGGLSVGNYK